MLTSNDLSEIWCKGTVVPGFNPTIVRKDACGAWIVRQDYGCHSPFGWDIDRILPASKGGDDSMINLRPMHWKNTLSKRDNYPKYMGAVTSLQLQNIEESKLWTINRNLQDQLKEHYGK